MKAKCCWRIGFHDGRDDRPRHCGTRCRDGSIFCPRHHERAVLMGLSTAPDPAPAAADAR